MRDNGMDAPAWRGDWRSRLAARVRAEGYDSLDGFFRATPGVPYTELARLLSRQHEIAPIHLEQIHSELAQARGPARPWAMDSMTRFMRGSLSRGWGNGKYWQVALLGGLASWTVLWGGGPRLQAIKEALFQLAPPVGWVPQNEDDPIVRKAFDLGWPPDTPD
jgi:hypothetical protein